MNTAQSQLFTTAARWLTFGRAEVIELTDDLRKFASTTRAQWSEDGSFRAHVIRQALAGLAAVVQKGPRATILWLMGVAANIVAAIALTLGESRAY